MLARGSGIRDDLGSARVHRDRAVTRPQIDHPSQDGSRREEFGFPSAQGNVERGPAVWAAFLLVGAVFDERIEVQEDRTFA